MKLRKKKFWGKFPLHFNEVSEEGCVSKKRKRSGEITKEQLSFFKVTDRNIAAWKNAIPPCNKYLKKEHVICELHFKKEEVLKHDIFVLPNCVVEKMKKKRINLKANSIPSIFPTRISIDSNSKDKINLEPDSKRSKHLIMDPAFENSGEFRKGFKPFTNSCDSIKTLDTKRKLQKRCHVSSELDINSADLNENQRKRPKIIADMTIPSNFNILENFRAVEVPEQYNDAPENLDVSLENCDLTPLRSSTPEIPRQEIAAATHILSPMKNSNFSQTCLTMSRAGQYNYLSPQFIQNDLDMDQLNDEKRHFVETSFQINETTAIESVQQFFKNKFIARESWTYFIGDQLNFLLLTVPTTPEIKYPVCLRLNDDLTITAWSPDGFAKIHNYSKIKKGEDIYAVLDKAENSKWCIGSGKKSRSTDCSVVLDEKSIKNKDSIINLRCMNCIKDRIHILKIENKKSVDYKQKFEDLTKKMVLLRRQNNQAQATIDKLRLKAVTLKCEVDETQRNAVQTVVSTLPDIQQTIVRHFLNFAEKSPRLRRYTTEWILECLLLRIKSNALYQHVRSKGILPLPTSETLDRYINKIDRSFGFHDCVFESLKVRAGRLEVQQKRGILILDEMSLNEALNLNPKTMLIEGFVDVGPFTPEKINSIHANHALVLLYRPLQGNWYQAIAAFPTKKCSGPMLDDVLVEGIKRIENSGFSVDGVATDGAAINRKVWKIHGIKIGVHYCAHPCDSNRKLFFYSDHSHLIKCFRNCIMQHETFWTPDGLVKKQHWRALLNHEAYFKYNLKAAYKLSHDHLDPKGFQKMNVKLAMELFSEEVYNAMEMYKHDPRCPELKDAGSTIAFIKRVNKLIKAMTSRTPLDALRLEADNENKKIINEFIAYIGTWEDLVDTLNDEKKEWYPFGLSQETAVGYKVTLAATIELLKYLHDTCNYSYLMTSRLLSDPIEKFFGIVRQSCGANEHPTPTVFSQVFRLLMSYSLAKPPKGSNVSGEELLQPLIQTKDSLALQKINHTEWLNIIHDFVERKCNDEDVNTGNMLQENSSVHAEHNYEIKYSDDRVMSHVSGFIVQNIKKNAKLCKDCCTTLEESFTQDSARHQFTDLKNKGDLLRSSKSVYELIKQLENVVLETMSQRQMRRRTMFYIVVNLESIKSLSYIGCEKHKKDLTERFIASFLKVRGKWLCDRHNAINNAQRSKTRFLRKMAKLVR